MQWKQLIKKMGSLKDLLGMIPGIGGQLKGLNIDDGQLKSIEAIIQSMTKRERMIPELVENEIKRKKRIASGCGQSAQHVTMLLKQFTQMKKMMSGLGKMKGLFGSGGGAEMDSIGSLMSGQQQFTEKDLQMAKNIAKGRPMPDKDAIKKKRKAEKQAKKANRKRKK